MSNSSIKRQIGSFKSFLSEPVRNGVYKTKEFHGRGQKIVNMKELFSYDLISNQDMKRVELDEKEMEKSLLQEGDLLFARRSLVLEGSGKCSLVEVLSEPTTFESSIIRARLNQDKANPRYFFYYFTSPRGKKSILAIASQTAVSGIKGSSLQEIEIDVPDLVTQQKISSILSIFDDFIENNTKRIKILENMARLIYREWFVHYRFPDHEKVKMVNSGTELGKVPEGWQIKKLLDIAHVNAKTIRAKNAPSEINYVDIASVSTGSIDKIERLSFEEAPSRARRIVCDGDILWSTVRPNRKSYSLVISPPDNLIASTGFAVITPRELPFTYLYNFVTTERFVSYLVNHARGAAYPAVNTEDFENAPILVPSENITSAFNDLIEPMLRLSSVLHKENGKLRAMRDLLVPKLISGQLTVS